MLPPSYLDRQERHHLAKRARPALVAQRVGAHGEAGEGCFFVCCCGMFKGFGWRFESTAFLNWRCDGGEGGRPVWSVSLLPSLCQPNRARPQHDKANTDGPARTAAGEGLWSTRYKSMMMP